ncbi:uncharacterized protein [Dermacentor albipictus]|uniref:uncharacterized protein isoform X1 n=1 Tax=Dermacentor albipictus TaxID=60249 RepID=UPI0038FD1394
MLISSRKDAMYWIGMHMVPNIVGVARFTYGFHRTGADVGRIFDICLGAESFANICSDIAVIGLLRKAEASQGADVDATHMTRVLGAFVTWNTVALLLCCGGNLAGLRFPPKWYTNMDADALSFQQRTKIAAIGAPIIVLAALCKLYYTSMLYDFYSSYKMTTVTAHEEALVESASMGQVEKRPASRNQTSDDVTSPRHETATDAKVRRTSTKLQARSGRLLPQSPDGEDHLTTIIPSARIRKLSDRSRRQSIASEFHTGARTIAKSKSGRTRRQSTASEFTRTIDDAAATIGRPVQGRSRRMPSALRGAMASVQSARGRRQSVVAPDSSAAPDASRKQRPRSAAAGAAARPLLVSVGKSGHQGSTFTDAKLLAKIISRRQTARCGGSRGSDGASADRGSSSLSSSATAGSDHAVADVPQCGTRTPRQSASSDGVTATLPVRNSAGQLAQEPLPTDEAGATADAGLADGARGAAV